jgi:hypothetical protein
VPREGDVRESLPEVESDLLAQVGDATFMLTIITESFTGRGEAGCGRRVISRR